MTEIRLEVAAGGLVRTATIPPFSPPPEIIGWGSRVFVRKPDGVVAPPDGPIVYVEGLMWLLQD